LTHGANWMFGIQWPETTPQTMWHTHKKHPFDDE